MKYLCIIVDPRQCENSKMKIHLGGIMTKNKPSEIITFKKSDLDKNSFINQIILLKFTWQINNPN